MSRLIFVKAILPNDRLASAGSLETAQFVRMLAYYSQLNSVCVHWTHCFLIRSKRFESFTRSSLEPHDT